MVGHPEIRIQFTYLYLEPDCGAKAFDDASAPIVVFAASDDVVVVFVGVGGMPHTLDSVSFTNLSFGSHIAAFCCGVNDGDVILLP